MRCANIGKVDKKRGSPGLLPTGVSTAQSRGRGGASAWQYSFGLDSEKEPLTEIRQHFQDRFDHEPNLDEKVDRLNREFEATYVQADFVPFTQEEVRSADIFLTKSKPDTWNTSVMTLLAKVAEPKEAKQLRPSMITSHIAKTLLQVGS